MNELEIIKQTLPVLEIKDYDKILEACQNDVKKYENYVVTKDSLDEDIKLRAEINNKSKAINAKRLEIEKVISQPIKDFKAKCDDLITLYSNASILIDTQIKVFETKQKEEYKTKVLAVFNESIGELKSIITLDMIFDDKWLNKGSFNDKGEFKLTNELISKLDKIRTDLEAIKNLKSEHELALTNQYLKIFDLGQIIIENNRLNELKTTTQKVEVAKEEIKQEKIEEMITKPVQEEEIEPTQTYKLEITGRLSQHKKLKEFLELNKMHTVNIETNKVIVE